MPVTHEQYLDLPMDHIEWTIRIHDLVERIENEREKPIEG